MDTTKLPLRVIAISAKDARTFNEEIEKFLARPRVHLERIHLPQPVAVGEQLHFTAFVEFRESA